MDGLKVILTLKNKITMTQDQINKLPKWAQSEFSRLNMRATETQKELDRINNNTPSNTFLGFGKMNGLDDNPTTYLKENQMVTFCLSNGEFKVRIENDVLIIHGTSDNIGGLAVLPHVSNVIRCKFL